MIKSILAAAILSLGVVTVALAFTPSPATSPKLVVTSDLIQVKSKGYKSGGYKGGKWHHGKGHGHRYAQLPQVQIRPERLAPLQLSSLSLGAPWLRDRRPAVVLPITV